MRTVEEVSGFPDDSFSSHGIHVLLRRAMLEAYKEGCEDVVARAKSLQHSASNKDFANGCLCVAYEGEMLRDSKTPESFL